MSAKCCPFCLGLNVLMADEPILYKEKISQIPTEEVDIWRSVALRMGTKLGTFHQ